MQLVDSRRLTGPNLAWDRPGALLDVAFSDDSVVNLWKEEFVAIRSALGLPDMGITVKRRAEGAWLVAGGPVDQLYGLIDASEQAWERAVERVKGGSPDPFNPAELMQSLKEEANPALVALQDEATVRGITFLWDDDYVSLGMGIGSQTWPAREIPSPHSLDWTAFHDVPVAVVTGTNGKSTTVRLLCAMTASWGKSYGNTSTDWVRVNEDVIDSGDYSGPGGARTALRDPRVEVALLETARGGLLRRGAGIERADVAAILNVAEDHMGQYGINGVADLIEAKLIVRRLVDPDGLLVLNADDEGLREAAQGFPTQSISWFSLDGTLPSGRGVTVVEDRIVLVSDDGQTDVTGVNDVPITLNGAAQYNVANALAAVAVAHGLGMPLDAIRHGLTSFESTFENNPGRSNWFDVDGFKVLLDYAHNPHGLRAILDTTARMDAERRVLLLSTAGDRTEKEIRELASMAARDGIQDILVADCLGYERELGKGGVPRILADQLARHGINAPQYESELEGVRAAISSAREGDLLILLVKGERQASLEAIQEEQQIRAADRP